MAAASNYSYTQRVLEWLGAFNLFKVYRESKLWVIQFYQSFNTRNSRKSGPRAQITCEWPFLNRKKSTLWHSNWHSWDKCIKVLKPLNYEKFYISKHYITHNSRFFLILFITYVLFYFASLNYSVHSYLHVYSNVKQTQPVFAKLLKCSTKKIHKHFFFYVNYV